MILGIHKSREQEVNISFYDKSNQLSSCISIYFEHVVKSIEALFLLTRHQEVQRKKAYAEAKEVDSTRAKCHYKVPILDAYVRQTFHIWLKIDPLKVKEVNEIVKVLNRNRVKSRNLNQKLQIKADMGRIVDAQGWQIAKILLTVNESPKLCQRSTYSV